MAIDGASLLTPGTIRDIFNDKKPASIFAQVIICRSMDKDPNPAVGVRYKIALSDSANVMQGLVTGPLAESFERQQVKLYDFVRVTAYQVTTVKDQRILVVQSIDLASVISGTSIVGNPERLTVQSAASAAAALSAPNASSAAAYATSARGNAADSRPAQPAEVLPPSTPYNESNAGGGGGGFITPATSTSQLDDGTLVQPISNLSPYYTTWVIRARVTNKSDVKRFANAKGEGKLFSFTAIDSSGEIRITAFGNCVDQFYDVFQNNQVYYISKASVRIAKRQFGVKNEYEIQLEADSVAKLTQCRDASIPTVRFDFVPISSIERVEKDATVDIIGVATDVGDLSSIITKVKQESLSKRDLTLLDTSKASIRLTLWGAQAESFVDNKDRPIVAIKGARVSDYSGRTISASFASTVSVNPDIREAHQLRGWYDSQVGSGRASAIDGVQNLSSGASAASGGGRKEERKTIGQIKDEALGSSTKPDYFNMVATVTFMKPDGPMSYTACPGEGCMKKVIEESPGMWRCENCAKVYDSCRHRYLLSFQVSDATGQTWVNAFDEGATVVMGKTAEEMHFMRINDDASFAKVCKEALFKTYLFRVSVKQDVYQGEAKQRCSIYTVLPVDAIEESSRIIARLAA